MFFSVRPLLLLLMMLLPISARADVCALSGSGIGGTGAPTLQKDQSGIGGTGLTDDNGIGGIGGTGNTDDNGIGGTGAVADQGIGGTGLSDEDGIGGTGIIANTSGIGGTGEKRPDSTTRIIGTITDFGSICVNGQEIHYDHKTPIKQNGKTISLSQLAIGQVVSLEAEKQNNQLQAKQIQIVNAVSGPIEKIMLPKKQLIVLGQTVQLTSRTQHGLSIKNGLGLKIGDFVQISGLRLANDKIVAQWLDKTQETGSVQLNGPAREVKADSFKIGELLITTQQAVLINNGEKVSVSGEWKNNTLIANQITVDRLIEQQPILIEGFININRDSNQIRVAGYAIESDNPVITDALLDTAVDQAIIVHGEAIDEQNIDVEQIFIPEPVELEEIDDPGLIISIEQAMPAPDAPVFENELVAPNIQGEIPEHEEAPGNPILEILEFFNIVEPDLPDEQDEIEVNTPQINDIEVSDVEIVDEHSVELPEVPEIEEPEAPEVETPEIEEVEIPEIDIPEIDEIESSVIEVLEVEELETPEIEEPETPEIEEPEIPEVEEPETPEVEEPETPEVEEPETPEIEEPETPEVEEPETPEVEEPETPEIEEPETPEIEEPETPEVEEPETPEVEEPETPEVEEPETPEVEEPETPEVEEPETPEVEEPETPEIEEPETPEVEEPETPEIEEPETPEVEEPETPEVEEPETPEIEEPETPEVEEPETPEAEEPETPEVEEPETQEVEEPETPETEETEVEVPDES